MKYLVCSTLLLLGLFQKGTAQDTCFTSLPYGNNPAAGAYASVNGIRMYYEVYGPETAQPLLLIHGNSSNIKDMRCQIEDFRSTYRVIIPESRYHGKSESGDEPLTYELMASDYAALLEYLKIDSVFAIGHSDGGILVLLLAMNHPGTIKKGCAMAPNLRPDSTAAYGMYIRMVRNRHHALTQEVASGNATPSTVRKQKLFKLMDEQPNIPAASLDKIRVPMLVMVGDDDVVKVEHMVEIFRALPKGNLLVFPGANHWAHTEEAYLFNQFCRRFFETPFREPVSN